MTDKPIGVGIIGANPDKGWGSSVHVPVIERLPGFTLAAVATTRDETARRSAEMFGAKHAFSDPQALVDCPDVDLVAVTVKAPEHYRLAMLALAAGKHVYCEWPLAANTVQAAEMAALAKDRGVRAMVGLQARGAPAMLRAKALIEEGYIGRMISVRMHCALPGGGRRRSQEGLYVIDNVNGASTLAIQGGHAIDALRFVVGEFAEFSAVVANQFDEVEVIETGARLPKDAPDQILVAGRLENGAVVSISINGGVVAGHGISFEVSGEEGALSIGWSGGLNFQMSELTLRGARLPDRVLQPMSIDDGSVIPPGFKGRQPYPGVDVPRATLVNVAHLYADMGEAISRRKEPSPDFAVGLELHRLLDAIVSASESKVMVRTIPA
jgi:predicted dehydrogenase